MTPRPYYMSARVGKSDMVGWAYKRVIFPIHSRLPLTLVTQSRSILSSKLVGLPAPEGHTSTRRMEQKDVPG